MSSHGHWTPGDLVSTEPVTVGYDVTRELGHLRNEALVDVSALAGRAKIAIREGELTEDRVGELAEAAQVAVLQCYWIVDHPEVR